MAFFDSYFWPFNKTHEKIIAIFVISAIMASIWNVFIKFRWHDEKLTWVVLQHQSPSSIENSVMLLSTPHLHVSSYGLDIRYKKIVFLCAYYILFRPKLLKWIFTFSNLNQSSVGFWLYLQHSAHTSWKLNDIWGAYRRLLASSGAK